jgi:hypothetical protein
MSSPLFKYDMMNALFSFVLRERLFGYEDGGKVEGYFVCFVGSGGCAIAIVALVTINEDQPSSSSYTERLCHRDILYTPGVLPEPKEPNPRFPRVLPASR